MTVLSMLMYLPFTKELNISASTLAKLTKKFILYCSSFLWTRAYLPQQDEQIPTYKFSLPLCLSIVFDVMTNIQLCSLVIHSPF